MAGKWPWDNMSKNQPQELDTLKSNSTEAVEMIVSMRIL